MAAISVSRFTVGIVLERGATCVKIKHGRTIDVLPVVILVGSHVVSGAVRVSMLQPIAIVRVNRTEIGVPAVIYVPLLR